MRAWFFREGQRKIVSKLEKNEDLHVAGLAADLGCAASTDWKSGDRLEEWLLVM